MEEFLNPQVHKIQISGIRRFVSLSAQYPEAIRLTLGEPDFHTPSHIAKASCLSIEENKTGYTPNAGLLDLRKAASSYFQEKFGVFLNPESEILVTTGSTQAIDICMRTILQPGDEVLLPGPAYPGYAPAIILAGGIPLAIDTREDNFILNKELLQKHMTSRTKAILFSNPSNPTGALLSKEEMDKIALLLEDKNIFILSDEVYGELVYDHPFYSWGIYPSLKKKVLLFYGLSKSHAMTGWRIGFLCGDEAIMKHSVKLLQYNTSCTSTPSQYAALQALLYGKEDSLPMKEEYFKRREFVCEKLQQMSLEFIKPQGAFYLFFKIPSFLKKSSWDFCVELLHQEKLALIPGCAFGAYGEGYVRLSYAASWESLEKGMEKLAHFLQQALK